MKNLGQLLFMGIDGTRVTPETERFLKDTGCGGVILFKRNIASLKQLVRFISELRGAAGADIVVAVDQEGGRVARLAGPFTRLPAMAALGRASGESEGLSFGVGRILGRELAAAGFNMDFAPVLDVATNAFNPVIGDRAFSSDANEVARLGAAFIRGMQGEGVASCAKHFPGHGDSDLDSHLGLPVIYATRKRLELCELEPFRVAISAGAAAVMTAHLLIPALDPASPATTSRAITRGLLREGFRHEGLIISDDLTMEGMALIYPPREAAWRAIAAGADIAMICRDSSEGRAAIEALRRATGEGKIAEAELTASLERVARFKARHCDPDAPRPPLEAIGCREHREIAAKAWVTAPGAP